MNCPKCGVAVTADEKFCSGCGAGIAVSPDGHVLLQERTPVISPLREASASTTRKYLLAMSAVIFVSGIVFFFWTRSESEADIQKAETMLAGRDSAEIDAIYKQQLGMTFEEAKAHQRGLVNLQLVVNIALAVIFLGLWFWAKTNPYAAAIIALFLFLTVIVVGAIYEPKTLLQGVLLKILFTVGLVQAVRAGAEERRMLGAT